MIADQGTVECRWAEDGSATVYGRLMARDGSGAAIPGQGRCLRKSDLTSMTFKVWDDSEPEVPINEGTVVINDCIFNTLQTAAEDPVWTSNRGFNFRHDLGPENFPVGNRTYTVEYRIVTAGGSVGWARFRGPASGVHTS